MIDHTSDAQDEVCNACAKRQGLCASEHADRSNQPMFHYVNVYLPLRCETVRISAGTDV
jgi:hypothetical protein